MKFRLRYIAIIIGLLVSVGLITADNSLSSPLSVAPVTPDSPDPAVSARLSPPVIRASDDGGVSRLIIRYEIPEGFHQTLQQEMFGFSISAPEGFAVGPIEYPEGIVKDGLVQYYGTVELAADLMMPDNVPAEGGELTVTARYQLCDEAGRCYFPESIELVVPLQVAAGSRLGYFLLLAFLGGLLLNVMPCVLPVLSLKALNLVGQAGVDRKNVFRGSMAYAAGILVSMLILAGIVIAIKLSGERVGWGFQFQNPAFVLILTSVVFVFALSLFDVFVINLPGMTTLAKAGGRKGLAGSFLTGVFAVLLATPCTAPLLGTALGFAFSSPPGVIVSMLLLVGLGLASPFIVLGLWPKFAAHLPKPGAWMNTFKEVMGFLLIGTVLFLLSALYRQVGDRIIHVLIYLSGLALASWILGRFAGPDRRRFTRVVSALVVILIVAGGTIWTLGTFPQDVPTVVDGNTPTSTGNLSTGTPSDLTGMDAGGLTPVGTADSIVTTRDISKDPREQIAYSGAVLQDLRATETPVFLIFTADWCATCKLNEATVLGTKEIGDFFVENGIRVMRGDYTEEDPEITSYLQSVGRAGVPVYAFYAPGASRPVLLPELLTKQLLKRRIEAAL